MATDNFHQEQGEDLEALIPQLIFDKYFDNDGAPLNPERWMPGIEGFAAIYDRERLLLASGAGEYTLVASCGCYEKRGYFELNLCVNRASMKCAVEPGGSLYEYAFSVFISYKLIQPTRSNLVWDHTVNMAGVSGILNARKIFETIQSHYHRQLAEYDAKTKQASLKQLADFLREPT